MLVGSRRELMTSSRSCYASDDDVTGSEIGGYACPDSGSYESFGTCDFLLRDDASGADDSVESFVSMTKSSSLPGSVATSSVMPPDPFPELSQYKMAPLSARMYSLDSRSLPPPSPPKVADSSSSSVHAETSLPPRASRVDTRNYPEHATLKFFNDDSSHHSFVINTRSTVAEICDELVMRNHTVHSPHWTIVERIGHYQLERGLEHHEIVYQTYKTWSLDDDGRFYFRKDFSKYELFRNPTQFFPEHMVDTKQAMRDDSSGLLTRSERYKNLLLQNLLANQCIPDIQGYIHIREGKRWKKHFCVLRGSGLYYSTKGTQRDPQFLVLITHLDDMNIFTALNAKKVFGAPTNYGFCLRPSTGTSDPKQWKAFSVEDEQSRLCWITGMRFVKYGAQLRENLRLTLKCDDSAKNTDTSTSGGSKMVAESPLYVKSRVAMDFSGDRGRVVADPNEALGIAFEEGYNWRKKAAAMRNCAAQIPRANNTETIGAEPVLPPPPALLPRPVPVTSVHVTQPWFHGHISREAAVSLIANQGIIDGVFLLRNSQSLPNVFVLSFVHNHKVKHCTIREMEVGGMIYYTLDGGITKFMDLIQLVDFYQLNAGALPTPLTYPVSRLL